jgi:hypothetical protein
MEYNKTPSEFLEYIKQEELKAVIRVCELREKYREIRDRKLAHKLAAQYNCNQYIMVEMLGFNNFTDNT